MKQFFVLWLAALLASCSPELVTKTFYQPTKESDTITYHQQVCETCNGLGHFVETCRECSGTGQVKSEIGRLIGHYACSGTGIYHNDCSTCEDGFVIHDNRISETWLGYKVRVETIPPGATIRAFDPTHNQMRNIGTSNNEIMWWMRNDTMPLGQSWYMVVTYDGMSVGVTADIGDKIVPKVVIDFTTNPPTVLQGKEVQTDALTPTQREAQRYSTLAWEAVAQGDYERGAWLYQKSLSIYEYGETYCNIGYVHLLSGKAPQAQLLYDKGIAVMSAQYDNQELQRRFDSIVKELEKLLERSKTPEQVQQVLEHIQEKRKEADQSFTPMEQEEVTDPFSQYIPVSIYRNGAFTCYGVYVADKDVVVTAAHTFAVEFTNAAQYTYQKLHGGDKTMYKVAYIEQVVKNGRTLDQVYCYNSISGNKEIPHKWTTDATHYVGDSINAYRILGDTLVSLRNQKSIVATARLSRANVPTKNYLIPKKSVPGNSGSGYIRSGTDECYIVVGNFKLSKEQREHLHVKSRNMTLLIQIEKLDSGLPVSGIKEK